MLKIQQVERSNYHNLKLLLLFLLFAIFVGVVLFGMESYIRRNFSYGFEWISAHTNPFILNYIILFLVFLVFFALFNDFLISFTVFSFVMLTIAVIDKYKFLFLGEYLYPWDVLLYQQLFNLLPQLLNEITLKHYLIAIVTVIIAVLAIWLFKKFMPFFNIKMGWISRIVLLLVSVGLIISFFFFRSTPLKGVFASMGIENINWNQATNYNINGFALAFVLNTESTIIFAPQGYSEENILQTIDELEKILPNEQAVSTTELEQKPNIIMIMNEAFWDPTLLQAVNFSKDPMPTVRSNQSGWLLSPQFGGGTANIEFEALTGLSVSFLPTGSIAYQQFVSRPVPSMASLLRDQGYNPVAIHPYYSWFWSREKVYPLIGFDQFISLDNFEGATYRGPYIADQEVNKRIISQTEKSEEPVFIYAVTMQNHGPYEKNRYKEVDVTVESSILSPESIDSLTSYTQGVVEADRSLEELINYYKKSEEPTILVFFGDHLPFLGANYLTYLEAGYIESAGPWSLEEYQRMRATPLVLWSNYMVEKVELPVMSGSFLPPYIMELAQLEKPLYYQFLEHYSGQLSGFTTSIKTTPNGELYKDTPDDVKSLEDIYSRLQYDLLFGKQYGVPRLFNKEQ
ncbi:sulfatase-like hydrolase/transferase [Bacillus sp. Marseille-P3661]|uniref:sulfatase-like hydrolase/transferase n=1 Tax=Bacillus sp. Marseille-P3661 TaxID=1936234 RepID=UPI0021555500|nr:sulfatase-like hydrolase/transferase [Bacillus sp. Marseille-P3661]